MRHLCLIGSKTLDSKAHTNTYSTGRLWNLWDLALPAIIAATFLLLYCLLLYCFIYASIYYFCQTEYKSLGGFYSSFTLFCSSGKYLLSTYWVINIMWTLRTILVSKNQMQVLHGAFDLAREKSINLVIRQGKHKSHKCSKWMI